MSKDKGLEVISYMTSKLEEMNRELEEFLVSVRGEKKCAVCDRALNGEDVAHSDCYRKEWKEITQNG